MTDSTEIERRLVKLLHPLEGIERGLDVSPRDPDSKVIGIRIGEIREIALCLRMIAAERGLAVPDGEKKESNI